jgi:hypothetical protein
VGQLIGVNQDQDKAISVTTAFAKRSIEFAFVVEAMRWSEGGQSQDRRLTADEQIARR